MTKRKTTKQFIQDAIKIHGDKYDYSDVIYINAITPVKIKCKTHDEFNQIPNSHLSGYGCSECAGNKLNTKEQFVEKATKIHGDRYDYSNFIYLVAKIKSTIHCYEHGDFEQSPHNHLKGKKCPECAKIEGAEKRKATLEEFIDAAIKVHGYKYGYFKVKYKNAKTLVVIFCYEHGYFNQLPYAHLSGRGCKKCSNNTSNIGNRWLDFKNIPNEDDYREVRTKINNKIYIFDGYDPETNTVYEFYGDKFHGNPSIYKFDDINDVNKMAYGELYLNTKERENIIKSAGYNLVTIWECEFKEIEKQNISDGNDQ